MMDWLKNKVHKRNYDDVSDIRSNVLGNDFLRSPEPDFPRPQADFPRPGINERQFNEPSFGQFQEPPGFSSIDVRSPDREKDYDILDRLNLIESQLSAIRSQTETINERLKNMERQLGRRY